MFDLDLAADQVAAHLRENYLHGVVSGLAEWNVSPAELPTLLGLMYADGIGSPRWTLARWVRRLADWIEDRAGLEKAVKITPGVTASKAFPNWLKPPELEAWTFARERAGLRIEGLADSMRARLRSVMADAISANRPRAETVKIVTERMEKAFIGAGKDWERIAVTELAAAFNEGVVTASAQKGVKLYRVRTNTDACHVCKDVYDGKTFTPAELIKVMPPILHPRCRCVVIPQNLKK